MGDTFTWRVTASGPWSAASNWADTTTSANPALLPPGAADTATIAGPSDHATYFAVSGPGNAASFTAAGNVGLSGGAFSFGDLEVGSSVNAALLDIGPGASVIANTASFYFSPLEVSGTGASLQVATAVSVSGNLIASNGGHVSLGGMSFANFGSLTVDGTATMEIGPGGGAPPQVGAITIDTGASVTLPGTGEGTFTGAVVNNGAIVIGGGSGTQFMLFTGLVSGSGSLVVESNGGIVLEGGDSAAIDFVGTTGLVNYQPIGFGYAGGISEGVVTGFAPGDTLNFTGLVFNAAAYAPTSPGLGTVTLSENGTSVGTVTLAGSFDASTTFMTLPDVFGDTALELAAGPVGAGASGPGGGTAGADSFVWQPASGGDWGVASNWLDNGAAAAVAPGSNDVVTINGAARQFQAIRGQGNSKSLNLTGDVVLGGAFATGALGVGTSGVVGDLALVPTTTVTATSVAMPNGSGTLSVDGATLSISGALSGNGSLIVTGGGKLTAASASFPTIYGITVDSTSIVDIGGTGGTPGFLTVEPGASISGGGNITASVIDNGLIAATNGVAISGPVTGSGTLLIGNAISVLTLNGPVAASNTIKFNVAAGTLRVTGPVPAAGISGFTVSDTIDFTTLVFDSVSDTPSGGNGTLALLSGGSQVGALTLLGNVPAATSFIVAPLGSGTEIMLAAGTLGAAGPSAGTVGNDVYQWTATAGGDWGNVANWSDTTAGVTTVAPGANDLVTIAGFGGSFEAISGQGNAATLTASGELAFGGIFQFGSLSGASGSTLIVTAGATLTAGNATFAGRMLDVTGTGAAMHVTGSVQVSNFGSINAIGGAMVIAAGLTTTGNTFVNVDAASAIEVGTAADAVAGSLIVDSGATLNGGFVIGAPVIDNGVITMGTGQLLELNAPVTGNGTIVIGSGGTLFLSSSVDPSVTIKFADATGNLMFGTRSIGFAQLPAGAVPGGVAAPIVGYTAGDAILVANTAVDTADFTASGPNSGTLTIGNNGSAAFALDLIGSFTAASFIVAPAFFGSEVLMSVECFAAGTGWRRRMVKSLSRT